MASSWPGKKENSCTSLPLTSPIFIPPNEYESSRILAGRSLYPHPGLTHLGLLRQRGTLGNLDQPGKNGDTLLMRAVGGKMEPHVRTFLQWGANPNACGEKNRTPLHLAAAVTNSKITRLLLSAGAQVDLLDENNNGALHFASLLGASKSLISSLLKSGADVNLANHIRNTPLHLAAGGRHPDVAALLIKSGAALDPLDEKERTPLLLAVSLGHIKNIQLLLSSGADPEKIPSPLSDMHFHLMVLREERQAIESLIRRACEHRILSREGITPKSDPPVSGRRL